VLYIYQDPAKPSYTPCPSLAASQDIPTHGVFAIMKPKEEQDEDNQRAIWWRT
jgi:hypothetical protein